MVGYVEIPEYNETLRYKKWLGNQWSQETYEPSVDTVIQEKLIALEENITMVTEENVALKQETETIKQQNNMVEGMLMEMMVMLETLTTQGGVE